MLRVKAMKQYQEETMPNESMRVINKDPQDFCVRIFYPEVGSVIPLVQIAVRSKECTILSRAMPWNSDLCSKGLSNANSSIIRESCIEKYNYKAY